MSITSISDILYQKLRGAGVPTITPEQLASIASQVAVPKAIIDLTEDSTHRTVTDAEKNTWNGKQVSLGFIPVATNDARLSDARTPTAHDHDSSYEAKNSNIQAHISSPHALPATVLIVSGDKATAANTTPVTLGVTFAYEALKTYVIDVYAIVAPTAATTGCSFLLDVNQTPGYVGSFIIHQLATSGTVSGGGSIGDLGATSKGVSSGMVGTGSNYVTGSMLLIGGANPGNATFFFQSETTAVTTCKSGTVFLVTKVN